MSTPHTQPQTFTLVEVEKIIAQWQAGNGPTPEEKDRFLDAAIDDLNNPEKVVEFQKNIEDVGVWANEVDEAFDRVSRGMDDIWDRHGQDFPDLAGFRADWRGYNRRWVSLLSTSRNVASTHITILRRFDQVFLHMIQDIRTDQDRLDVIRELDNFANENHSASDEMSKGFFELKNDILAFVERFDTYVEQQGTQLQDLAVALRAELDSISRLIVGLNLQIFSTTVALMASAAGAATMLGLLGVVAATLMLAWLIAERADAERNLQRTQRELEDVNRRQQALAHLKGSFDGLKPDINLICEKLALFGEIWQSVRSETIRFQTHLKTGMDAVNDERFKKEVRLGREMCGPLQTGLEKYSTQLLNRRGRE